jgi:plastocyanin
VTPTTRRQLARGPALAVAGLVLAGCGGAAPSPSASSGAVPSGSAAAATPSSGTASSAGASGCGVGQKITVTGSKVSPPPSTLDVEAGCEVTLTVMADRTSEVHIHVVELEKPIIAGQPLTVVFTPTQQGVYEVELHDPDLLLVKLAVR